MTYHVYVDGQEGTTGLRINEYLARRNDVEVLRIDPERRKDNAERARLLNAADVAFLCLPDVAAREAAALVTNPNTCLIDASTAHRTSSDWVFGLPELAPEQREKIRRSKRISNPGCHSTAFILLVRPLVDAGLIAPDMPISATSITGYSGGGKKMIEQYESGDPALLAPRPYGLGLSHKHLPEMKAHTRMALDPVFLPIVGPFLKGLSVTVPLHLSQLNSGRGASANDLQRALDERYAGEPFIRVMPLRDAATLAQGHFNVQAANDTNRADLFVFATETQALLMSRLDNLGKGASGAAVQSMNVHLGLEETAGLV
ncbi:N-acetyl-gamma-glutamyl-phosphate reductase [Piscinibacter koreensis]|uniref:N-acetyl-gamma-glutamyl-phosphate reductase n=1 Tax=Piscinibacter koreensis TaxID=2742824 RepID=A0A7Y6NJL8_9BURK|nr:N-acetyl-gamma-glutamyl-phosphate reductase [Schlegelella koreensis]NUZ04347.1 N-acetyl-gamma-glutamyl-phosphate reductase [Schlegelella koreensis]